LPFGKIYGDELRGERLSMKRGATADHGDEGDEEKEESVKATLVKARTLKKV
jgi:hypothetical protein